MRREIGQAQQRVIRAMAGPRADRYISDVLIGPLSRTCHSGASTSELVDSLDDPIASLRCVYHHYAFARRGKERAELSEIAIEALADTSQDAIPILEQHNGQRIWEAFVAACVRHNKRPLEQLNVGVIAGLTELAQEIKRNGQSGSIHRWIVESVQETGIVEPLFMRIVDIRGVGPKLASLILRDAVFLGGVEDKLENTEHIYLQPIDRYVRQIAPYIVEEPEEADAPDWVLAGKIAKYVRLAGCSGIRFSMGVAYFGVREASNPIHFDATLQRLISEP
jgi:hypothetical protein